MSSSSWGCLAVTENGKYRTIISAFDKCNAIYKLYHELAACYYSVEIIKVWRIK